MGKFREFAPNENCSLATRNLQHSVSCEDETDADEFHLRSNFEFAEIEAEARKVFSARKIDIKNECQAQSRSTFGNAKRVFHWRSSCCVDKSPIKVASFESRAQIYRALRNIEVDKGAFVCRCFVLLLRSSLAVLAFAS